MGVEYKVILLRLANIKKHEANSKEKIIQNQSPKNAKRKNSSTTHADHLKKQYYFQPFEDWPLG